MRKIISGLAAIAAYAATAVYAADPEKIRAIGSRVESSPTVLEEYDDGTRISHWHLSKSADKYLPIEIRITQSNGGKTIEVILNNYSSSQQGKDNFFTMIRINYDKTGAPDERNFGVFSGRITDGEFAEESRINLSANPYAAIAHRESIDLAVESAHKMIGMENELK